MKKVLIILISIIFCSKAIAYERVDTFKKNTAQMQIIDMSVEKEILQENSTIILQKPLIVRYAAFALGNFARPIAKIPAGIEIKLIKKHTCFETDWFLIEWYSSVDKKKKQGMALEYAIKSKINVLTPTEKEQAAAVSLQALGDYLKLKEKIKNITAMNGNLNTYKVYLEKLHIYIFKEFIATDMSDKENNGFDRTISEMFSDMALVYIAVGKLNEATKCAEESVFYDKSNVYMRGMLYLKCGYYSKARQDFVYLKQFALLKGAEAFAIEMDRNIRFIDNELNKLK